MQQSASMPLDGRVAFLKSYIPSLLTFQGQIKKVDRCCENSQSMEPATDLALTVQANVVPIPKVFVPGFSFPPGANEVTGGVGLAFQGAIVLSGGGQMQAQGCNEGGCNFSVNAKAALQVEVLAGAQVGPLVSADLFGKTGVEYTYTERNQSDATGEAKYLGLTVGYRIVFLSGLPAIEIEHTILQPIGLGQQIQLGAGIVGPFLPCPQ